MTLELLGSLEEDEDRGAEIILGLAEGNRICTLQNAIRTSSKFSRAEVYRSSYIVHRLFEGKHFASAEQICFTSFSISYTSFEDWITDCPYDETHEADESSDTLKITSSHTVPYPLFDSRIASLDSTVSGRLGFEGSIGIRTLEWKSTGYVDILPDQSKSFDWF